jgi:excisionase family DNA binding protein
MEAITVTKEAYLKPREAAEYLRSSTSTLAKARMYKRGPLFVRIGRAVRYRQSDLDAWMSASVAQQTEKPGNASTANTGDGR